MRQPAGRQRLGERAHRRGGRAGRDSTAPPSACRAAGRASAAGTGRGRPAGSRIGPGRTARGRRARGTAWSCRCRTGPGARRRLALADGEVDVAPAAACRSGSSHLDVVERERGLRLRPRSSNAGSSRCGRLGLGHRLAEGGQPVDVGLPVGEAGEGVDEPGQRALHLAEGVGRLGQHAERDLAGEVARRGDDIGKTSAAWP